MEVVGGSGTFPTQVLQILRHVTGVKQQDVLPVRSRGLCRKTNVDVGGGTRLQEADPCSELDTVTYPVSALDSHGDAVVELQSGDVSEPEHDSRSVRPADALS